jgi:hypothetical protein
MLVVLTQLLQKLIVPAIGVRLFLRTFYSYYARVRVSFPE